MKKHFIASIVMGLSITSSLQAHPVSSDEIKQFAVQALQIDFDKAPEEVKQKISSEYTQRIKLAETLVVKLKNDPEYIRFTETFALDLWSKRIASSINPSDEELKKVFSEAKDLNIAPSYKLRHIVVMEETSADTLINQLKAKAGDEQGQLFTSLAATQSLDQNTKQKGGSIGWVDASILPQSVSNELKGKQVGDIVKLPAGKEMWDILLLEEIKPEHSATFEEAKTYLTNMLRQQAVENEAKKILGATEGKPTTSVKPVKKSQHK
ncbi:MAG: peptidyl-prolyl cis-trans isomerase [Sulfuricurvum sp.]|nr:peptidyl-prolyl cis-trans isomerase [Sulfuricurvum sp.]